MHHKLSTPISAKKKSRMWEECDNALGGEVIPPQIQDPHPPPLQSQSGEVINLGRHTLLRKSRAGSSIFSTRPPMRRQPQERFCKFLGVGSIHHSPATHIFERKMKIFNWDQCPPHHQSGSCVLESSISASLLLHWYQWVPGELWQAIGSRSIKSKEPWIGICNCSLCAQTTRHQLSQHHQKSQTYLMLCNVQLLMTFGDTAKIDAELSETLCTLHTARNVQGSSTWGSSCNADNIPTVKINVKTELTTPSTIRSFIHIRCGVFKD